MSIDWFTFTAQIINFLILLALLKRFLYGPILKAIADREAQIADQFEQLEQQQAAADAARRDYETQQEELAHAKQGLLAAAADEVDSWKHKRLAEAETEVERARKEWYAALDREREQLRADLLEQYQRDSLRLAEGVLACLVDSEIQQLMVQAFLRRLQVKPHKPASRQDPVTVRTAFELSDAQQQELSRILQAQGYDADSIQFRVEDALICGIELRTCDHETSWNARESLDWLMDDFRRDLNETLSLPDNLVRGEETSGAR